MATEAKWIKSIIVKETEMAVYQHQNGGIFAIDTSFLDQVADENDELDCYVINDPFAPIGEPQDLYLIED